MIKRLILAVALALFGFAHPLVAQSFTVVADPNPDSPDGYNFYRDGQLVGSNTQPSWVVPDDASGVHRWTVAAYRYDTSTGTMSESPTGTPPVYLQGPCGSTQIQAEYFNGLDPTTAPKVGNVCVDAVQFNWGAGGPFPEFTEQFSARYTIPFITAISGTTQWSVTADDGVRLLVDGVVQTDKWFDQGATTYTGSVDLPSGNHTAVLMFYENSGDAVVQLSFATPTLTTSPDGTKIVPPTSGVIVAPNGIVWSFGSGVGTPVPGAYDILRNGVAFNAWGRALKLYGGLMYAQGDETTETWYAWDDASGFSFYGNTEPGVTPPPPPPPPPPSDTIPPSISFSSLVRRNSSTYRATAHATDNVKLARIDMSVDGVSKGYCLTSATSYDCTKSFSVPRGQHTVTAVATDAAGLQSTATTQFTR